MRPRRVPDSPGRIPARASAAMPHVTTTTFPRHRLGEDVLRVGLLDAVHADDDSSLRRRTLAAPRDDPERFSCDRCGVHKREPRRGFVVAAPAFMTRKQRLTATVTSPLLECTDLNGAHVDGANLPPRPSAIRVTAAANGRQRSTPTSPLRQLDFLQAGPVVSADVSSCAETSPQRRASPHHCFPSSSSPVSSRRRTRMTVSWSM